MSTTSSRMLSSLEIWAEKEPDKETEMGCPVSYKENQDVLLWTLKGEDVLRKREHLSLTIASEISSRMRIDVEKIGRIPSDLMRSFLCWV